MVRKWFRQRPLLNLPQLIVLLGVIAALFIGLDLRHRAEAGQNAGVGEEALHQAVELESTRQVELQATLTYVQSADYVAAYARDEAGQILPSEQRIVPLFIEATPAPTPVPEPTPDPIINARPWQAWWQLMTDTPLPTRP